MDTARAKFDCLFEAFEAPVRNYCARRLEHDDVDDAVNDTFAIVWRKVDLAPEGTKGLLWLYGIAHRVVQHTWRSNGRAARLRRRTEAIATVPPGSLDDRLVEDEDRRRVLEAASCLEAADQEILRLTLWEELSLRDAAVVLDITPEAARQRASRARSRLAREFRRLEAGPDRWARPPVDSRKGMPR